MSEETEAVDGPEKPVNQELEVLKSRARLMGITFSNNIGVDALKQKITEKLNEGETSAPAPAVNPLAPTGPIADVQPAATPVDPAIAASVTPVATPTPAPVAPAPVQAPVVAPAVEQPLPEPVPAREKPMSLRQRVYMEQMRLVRIRVTCMNPQKSDLKGEVFTVANEYLGAVKRFVPFGDQGDNGWHVPYCIYKMMQRRRFLLIRTNDKPGPNGAPMVQAGWAKEFAIEILPPLSDEEIERIRVAQIASGTVNADNAMDALA